MRRNWNWILNLIRSPCNDIRPGVIWELYEVLVSSLAAEYWTECNWVNVGIMSITRAWITVKLQHLGLSFLSGALSFVRCSLHQISSYLNEKNPLLNPSRKILAKGSATPRPPSRHTCGISFKILLENCIHKDFRKQGQWHSNSSEIFSRGI